MTQQDTILILSDRPDQYEPVIDSMSKKGTFFSTSGLLIRELLTDPVCSGVILDAKLVMATDADDRDKLFALCKDIPMVRSRIDLETNKPVFIDPITSLIEASPAPARRTQQRIKVRMEASWSSDLDPAMTETNEGVVLDLSTGGAFLHATNVLPVEDYLHLKIFELTHQRPIHCAVRWRMTTPQIGQTTGVGLKFLDISQAQLDEIKQTYLDSIQS